MGNRDTYDQSLRDLDDKILAMAGHAADAVESAMGALENSNLAAAQAVVEGDDRIDREEHAIEHLCLGLIACQQPVAGDLRKISTAMKVVTDLERLGDAAGDIAEITLRRGNEVIPELLSVLSATGRQAVSMIRSAIAAYASEDLTLAAKVIAQDDVVDNYFSEIKQKLTKYFAQEHPEIDCAIDYLMIAKYLERIGDHAVNLAEWVQFCKTGIHKHQRIV